MAGCSMSSVSLELYAELLCYYWTTLNFEIPIALVFKLEVYYKVDRLLTDLIAQQIEQLFDGIQIKHL